MKHLLKLHNLPSFIYPYVTNGIIRGGGKDSIIPFVILTTIDNKLTYTPDKIYNMSTFSYSLYDGYINTYCVSLDDVYIKDVRNNTKLSYKIDNYLFFTTYSYNSRGVLNLTNLTNYKSFFKSFTLNVNTDSIDVKQDNNLVTTLTLTGLKKKNSNERDFVGEIASYQDDLIKVDRTNPDNPTIEFLSFNNSQYKDSYEREERIKLFYIPFDML